MEIRREDLKAGLKWYNDDKTHIGTLKKIIDNEVIWEWKKVNSYGLPYEVKRDIKIVLEWFETEYWTLHEDSLITNELYPIW